MFSLLYKPVVIAGCLITIAEFVLFLLNSSLCASSGCRIVEGYLRFSEGYMYAAGFLFFAALLIAELHKPLRKYGVLLLMVGLAVEGYLVGFQLFVAGIICTFCIIIASLIICLALIKLSDGIREPLIAGFVLFAIIFSAVYSINASSAPIPSAPEYVLIVSRDCRYCEEVKTFAREHSVRLTHQDVEDVRGAMRMLGLDSVPVLVCNDPDGKKIYSGAASIIAVLRSRAGLADSGRVGHKVSISGNKKALEIGGGNRRQMDETPVYGNEPAEREKAFGSTCSVVKSSDVCK